MDYKHDVTVIIPVYNAEMYLEKCIKSLEANEGIKLEIIAINDASTDGSYDTLLELAAKSEIRERGSFIVLDNETNMGTAQTLDRGFEAATGKYIAVVDADDFVASHAFSSCFKYMEANSHVDYLYTLYEGFNKDETRFRRGSRCKRPAPRTTKELVLANLKHFITFHMKFIRASSYRNMTPWREMPRSAVDYAFVLANMFDFTFERLDLVLYYYRINTPGGHSTANKKLQAHYAREAQNKAKQRAIELGILNEEDLEQIRLKQEEILKRHREKKRLHNKMKNEAAAAAQKRKNILLANKQKALT